MPRREHSGSAAAAKLAGNITNVATTISCDNLNGWPTGAVGPFFVVIGRGTPTEEKILCQSRTGNTLTVASGGRGADGSAASAHSINDVIEHVFVATEADEMNAHIMQTTGAHGLAGAVVGTTDAQVLTNKTIDGDNNTFVDIPYSAIPNLSTDLANRPTQSAVTTQLQQRAPVGSIVMWGSPTPPAHWAICDGSALSTTTYAALFAVLGYTFGGSGGTFNLPDFRGKQPLGVNGSHPLAQTGGAESTVLGMGQIPQHSHAIDHNHGSFNTTDGAGAHVHSIATKTGTTSSATGAPQEVTGGSASTVNSASAGGHNHAIDVPAHVGTSGNAGAASPTSVPTLDPFLALNFIIYKGAA